METPQGAVVDGEIKHISLEDYKGKWTVVFFYPKDFTYVCPTEIIAFSDAAKRFEEIGAKVIGASSAEPNSDTHPLIQTQDP